MSRANLRSFARAIEAYLNKCSAVSLAVGHELYQSGAVEMLSKEHERLFLANVRVGGKLYEIDLYYDPALKYLGFSCECACSKEIHCEHIVAALHQIKASAPAIVSWGTNGACAFVDNTRKQKFLPESRLSTAVAERLGRGLSRPEADYLRKVVAGFQDLQGRHLTVRDLMIFSPTFFDYSWEELNLWPRPPKDDYEFWQYIVWELRRRKQQFPEFMLCVTDTSLIEQEMLRMEREKRIEEWRGRLRNNMPDAEAEQIDFRLEIRSGECSLQWRTGAGELFSDVGIRQFQSLRQNFAESRIVPEAILLWMCFQDAGLYGFEPGSMKFKEAETMRVLNRILRIASLHDRIVEESGEPLARPSEPLKYRLEEPVGAELDYELKLVRPDGTPVPKILMIFPGQPTLYLTARAVFQGPPVHNLDVTKPLSIPAPALESHSGVKFIRRLGVPLPSRIVDRTRNIQAKVKVRCRILPVKGQRKKEMVRLDVSCCAEGQPKESLSKNGWSVERNGRSFDDGAQELTKDGYIPLIDEGAKRFFPDLLEPLKPKWDAVGDYWRVILSSAFPERFAAWAETLPTGIELELDKELATLREAPVAGTVQWSIEESEVDWFDLKVALQVTDLSLTQEELKLLLNARGGFVRLGAKGWRRLQFNISPEENERLAQLGLHQGDFSAEPQRLHALQLANPAARKFLPETEVERIERRASDIKTRVMPEVPAKIQAELRPYQLSGYHFLSYLSANRFGGVLADDMGLGKTLQALVWLVWLRESETESARKQNGNGDSGGNHGPPALVVCPKSVMDNWSAEAARFTPGMRVRLWRGEDAATLPEARAEADLLVLNYAQLRSLSPEIAAYEWQAAILDEAQNIKNPDSQSAQAARALRARHRLALTGTPIENRLMDLWSIFSFAMPGVLGNRAHFLRGFNQQDDPFARQRLAARVRPFLLRRTKAQVAQDLPDKIEEDVLCEMEGPQKTLYRAEFKAAQQRLLGVRTQQELNEQRFNFLTSLLRLRQICCHPALVDNKLMKAESAKLNALLDMIDSIIDEGHKVLVFSQFVSMLDLLREAITERGWKHFYLAGDTENRGQLVSDFQNHEGGAVFLISLKAGGSGLNLTAASYVVLFDPWWNPAVESQAIDRTHRIGQVNKIIAYRLIMKDSVEQKIRQLQRTKAALAQDVLGEERFSQSLTLEDLRFLFEE